MLSILSLSTVCLIAPGAAIADSRVGDTDAGREDPVLGRSETVAPDRPVQSASDFREGDKVQLIFYEKLDVEEDRWRGAGNRGAVPRSFHQRTELTGEYVVQEDGAISLPMIGRFAAAGRGQDAVLVEVTAAFERLVERKGFVSVVGVEHQPVYVVGQVKNPGTFKYRPGMTVLQAVALAGGARQQEIDPWRRVEYGREVEHLQKSLDRVKHLLARTSVLQAERDGRPVAKGELVNFVGHRNAGPLVGEETWQRTLTAMNRGTQETALTLQLSNAQSELAARQGRLTPIDANIELRKERVKNMNVLVERNIISKMVLIQAQTELSDALDKRQQNILEVEAAKRRVSEVERELNKFRVEVGVEVNRATAAAERETLESVDEADGVLGIVKTLVATQTTSVADEALRYEVARRVGTGTVVLSLPETASLEPGDVVKLRGPDPQASLPSEGSERSHKIFANNDKNKLP